MTDCIGWFALTVLNLWHVSIFYFIILFLILELVEKNLLLISLFDTFFPVFCAIGDPLLEGDDLDFKERTMHTLRVGIRKIWKRGSATITEADPTYKVAYLGNVLTGWAKGMKLKKFVSKIRIEYTLSVLNFLLIFFKKMLTVKSYYVDF